MQPIQSLVAEAERLSKSFHTWNNMYMYLVCATAIFVALTFIAQWRAKTLAEALEVANNAVIRAKDEQLKDELAHRDERIAKVKAEADVQIAEVEADADDKIFRAKQFAEEIGIDSNRKTAKLREQNLATEAKLLSAQKDLEKEKLIRLELEKTLYPRIFVFGPGKTNIDSLKPFAGTVVDLEALNDAEAQRAARQIAVVLTQAGWKIENRVINPELNRMSADGVRIETEEPPPKGPPSWEIPSYKASVALADFLKQSGWESVFHGFGKPGEIPTGKIRIRVGFKPSMYFLDKLVQPEK